MLTFFPDAAKKGTAKSIFFIVIQSNLDLRDLDLRDNLDLRDFLPLTDFLIHKKSQFKGFEKWKISI